MSKKKRLGRGLEALLSKPSATEEQTPDATGNSLPGIAGDRLRNVPVDLLRRGQYQPRIDMRQDTLEDLANSIRSQGVVQPIVVRPLGNGPLGNGDNAGERYEIVAGERRWRAAQMAGLQEIPAVIRDVPDDAAIAMALIENIQRENLNPLEEARALDRLIREFELTHQAAAEAVGRSRAAVSNLLRLLDLSDKVKPMLESRQIEMGHARALLPLVNAAEQLDVAQQIIAKGLSVRETEGLVRRMQGAKPAAKRTADDRSPNTDVRRLEIELSDKLGARVRIDHAGKGHGKLVIAYNNLDELDGILQHIH